MTRRRSALRGLLVLALSGAPAVAQPPPGEVTLEAALSRGLAESPETVRAAAVIEEARGRLVTARTYPHNPRIELEGGDRRGPGGGSTTDRSVALSQEIEIAGQRGRRIAEARADLAVAKARAARARQEVQAAVTRSFAAAIRGRELLAVAEADVDLTANLLSLEERRLEAGAGTRIEVNLARAAAGRAVRRRHEAEAAWLEARARLAEAMGAESASPPRAAGSLPAGPERLPPLDRLVDRALDGRADLAALRRERERAEHRVSLERVRRVPDLELGGFASREEGDDVLGLRVGIAVPLFDRNRGAIAEASAAVDRQGATLAAAELAVRREVAAAFGHYRAAARSTEALRGLVIDTLEDSLGLLRKAVAAGELSATDVLLLRRELVDGRREQIEAAGELWLARTELELAVGGELLAPPVEQSRGGVR